MTSGPAGLAVDGSGVLPVDGGGGGGGAEVVELVAVEALDDKES